MNRVIAYSMLVLSGTFISSVSQVLLKKSAMKAYRGLLFEYLNPLVISGYCLFFGATLLSVVAYRVIPLSLGTVLESSSYLFITVFGKLVFDEKINRKKLFSLFLIVIGIMVFSFG